MRRIFFAAAIALALAACTAESQATGNVIRKFGHPEECQTLTLATPTACQPATWELLVNSSTEGLVWVSVSKDVYDRTQAGDFYGGQSK